MGEVKGKRGKVVVKVRGGGGDLEVLEDLEMKIGYEGKLEREQGFCS